MAPNQGATVIRIKARIPEIHTVRRRTNVKINVPDSRPASSLRRMREIGHEVERGGEPPSRVTRITDTAAGGGPATYEHTSNGIKLRVRSRCSCARNDADVRGSLGTRP